MAVKNLTNLVLRGVPVLMGGVTVETRRGVGYHGDQTPAPIPMRFPANHAVPNPLRRTDQEQERLQDAAAKRAGRSASSAGKLRSRSKPSVRTLCWPWFTSATASLRGSDVRSRIRLASAG
jgi:hypothetical protein